MKASDGGPNVLQGSLHWVVKVGRQKVRFAVSAEKKFFETREKLSQLNRYFTQHSLNDDVC